MFGYKKIAAATPVIKVADCETNSKNIIECAKKADKNGADLTVFPELCITGYTCGDLFLQRTLLNGAKKALTEITEETKNLDTAIIVGAPLENEGKLYNCGVFIYKGEILGVVPKTFIPNYTEFYELRHFTPASGSESVINIEGNEYPFDTKLIFRCIENPDFAVAMEICEDLWVANTPSTGHALAGATVIANISASDETICKDEYRRKLVEMTSARLLCGYVYCDAGDGESTQDLVFSGHRIICENGSIVSESGLFENGIIYGYIDTQKLAGERKRMNTFECARENDYWEIEFSQPEKKDEPYLCIEKHPFVPENKQLRAKRCHDILTMQAAGLKKRIEHTNAPKIVVGISGGLDSCLALLVCVRAMEMLKRNNKDIIAITMPCFGTTKRTRTNAQILCERLGTLFEEIDITKSVLQHLEDIRHDKENHNVVYENAQARERTKVLMNRANEEGGMVVGTGDLSELALGWATYNGDHMSMYGVNASIPKTLVRHIVRYYADISPKELKKVLEDILDTPVSPELLPAKDGKISQKTEDIVGPYDLHDFFLYYMLRFGFEPKKIFWLATKAFEGEFDKVTIHKWLKIFIRRFFSQQFKRSCLPDGPKVGSVTLSPRGDFRMPSDAVSALWLKEVDEIKF